MGGRGTRSTSGAGGTGHFGSVNMTTGVGMDSTNGTLTYYDNADGESHSIRYTTNMDDFTSSRADSRELTLHVEGNPKFDMDSGNVESNIKAYMEKHPQAFRKRKQNRNSEREAFVQSLKAQDRMRGTHSYEEFIKREKSVESGRY